MIDLSTYADRYRIAYDESYYAQYGDSASVNDPWLKIIRCKRGHIYPHSDTLLAAATNQRFTGKMLAAIPGCKVLQDASDGMNVSFPVEMLDQVLAVMKPYRKRKYTPEQREAAAKRLAVARTLSGAWVKRSRTRCDGAGQQIIPGR